MVSLFSLVRSVQFLLLLKLCVCPNSLFFLLYFEAHIGVMFNMLMCLNTDISISVIYIGQGCDLVFCVCVWLLSAEHVYQS